MATPSPEGSAAPVRPRAVRALLLDAGEVGGHRVTLLSLEDWGTWADLRFARVAGPGAPPLPRRIPLATEWEVTADGVALEVVDVTGRGDRASSTGEVRLRPAPDAGAEVRVRARFAPGAEATATFVVP